MMSSTSFDLTAETVTSPSEMIPVTLAEQADVGPTELPPLYSAIDPDALDALFRDRQPGQIAFEYAGYEVIVRDHDRIDIRELDEYGTESSSAVWRELNE